MEKFVVTPKFTCLNGMRRGVMSDKTDSDDFEIIYTAYITVKGKRIYARSKGLKAFAIRVRKKK